MHPDLDRGDLRILDLVQEHGHLSAAEVAERLGMTASTCWRRISRLEELGVIRKRVALLDREKLGLPVMVFSHVKLAGHGRDALLRFEQAVRAHPEILECYTLMGETDFLLRIVCRDIKAYEAFFLDHVALSRSAVGQLLDCARRHQGDDRAASAALTAPGGATSTPRSGSARPAGVGSSPAQVTICCVLMNGPFRARGTGLR